jgi:hypothetical protein
VFRRRAGLGNRLFWEPAHFVMQTRQFAQLRLRAEGTAASPAGGGGIAPRARHARP